GARSPFRYVRPSADLIWTYAWAKASAAACAFARLWLEYATERKVVPGAVVTTRPWRRPAPTVETPARAASEQSSPIVGGAGGAAELDGAGAGVTDPDGRGVGLELPVGDGAGAGPDEGVGEEIG